MSSKKVVADWIGAWSAHEIVSTHSSTYAANIIAQALSHNDDLTRGDVVILSVSEHHANIVPWLILKDRIGIEIRYVRLNDEYQIDLDHLQSLLDERVKVVSVQHVSNVTWAIHPIEQIRDIIGTQRYFVLDLAQSVPHTSVDVGKLDCDFAFFSGHKMMWSTWVGILYAKKDLLKKLRPPIGWWSAINFVTQQDFEFSGLPNRWEPGNQNVEWLLSVATAIHFLSEHKWCIYDLEQTHTQYTLTKFDEYKHLWIKLYGPKKTSLRHGIFSFTVDGVHVNDISEYLAQNSICVRSWHHCCQLLHDEWGAPGTVRMSLYLYNQIQDIDRFFELLCNFIVWEKS